MFLVALGLIALFFAGGFFGCIGVACGMELYSWIRSKVA